jgi:hypothetical protein
VHFSLSDLAADIAQNGAESGASLLALEIRETVRPGGRAEFRFIIRDKGKGMSASALERAMDPFVTDGVKHPGRKVGLGIPFLIQTAEQSGGGWEISTAKEGCEPAFRSGGAGLAGNSDDEGPGTTVEAWFDLANVDTPPVGDIPGLFRTVLLFAGPQEIVIRRRRVSASGISAHDVSASDISAHDVLAHGTEAGLDYEMKKTELTEALGDLEDVSSLVLLGKYLRSLEGLD